MKMGLAAALAAWYNSCKAAIIPAHKTYSAAPQNRLRIRAKPYHGRIRPWYNIGDKIRRGVLCL